MATTTPNFGWSVPTSSDLVKNGATAIETLGDSIDASLVDLKGGTTGQVLAKASGTDMDFSWVTDATGIPATIFDAKGDIIAATAADTASRLAVGANDTVLTADSSTATGLKWATPAAGGGMTLLSTTTLSGATTTISSISGAYNQLCIQIFDAYGSGAGGMTGRFNGNSTAAAYQYFFSEPGSNAVYPTATDWFYATGSSYSWTTGSLKSSDTNFFLQILLPNYADTTSRKLVNVMAMFENNGSNQTLNLIPGFWNNTAAINEITFNAPGGGGSWTQGTVKIWGIK